MCKIGILYRLDRHNQHLWHKYARSSAIAEFVDEFVVTNKPEFQRLSGCRMWTSRSDDAPPESSILSICNHLAEPCLYEEKDASVEAYTTCRIYKQQIPRSLRYLERQDADV